MRKMIVPVLGCAFAVLFAAGYYGAAGTGCPAYGIEEAGLAEDRIMTEPSDSEALSVDEGTVTEQSAGSVFGNRTYVLKPDPESGKESSEQAAERPNETDFQPSAKGKKVSISAASEPHTDLGGDRGG